VSGLDATIDTSTNHQYDILEKRANLVKDSQEEISSAAVSGLDATIDTSTNHQYDLVEKNANIVTDAAPLYNQRRNFRTCKITLVADNLFFWTMGRGNEASTTGRMLYYLDFVDSFLRSQTWSPISITEAIGLELHKIHLETSFPKDNSKHFSKLVTQLKTLPQYSNEHSGCLTIAFTATATPYEFHEINKRSKICAGTEANNENSFNDILLINTVAKDGTEVAGSEIIRNLLNAVLTAFGGSPDCKNISPLREKFYSNALRNLTMHHCLRDQISEILSRKDQTQCLMEQVVGVCDASQDLKKCDCGYRGNCLSADNLCCMSIHTERFLEKPFLQCPSEHLQSNCREPMGVCNSQDSFCKTASNYVNGSLGEKYALEISGMAVDTEDGTSKSEEVHFRSVSSVIMAILWYSMFNFLFRNPN